MTLAVRDHGRAAFGWLVLLVGLLACSERRRIAMRYPNPVGELVEGAFRRGG